MLECGSADSTPSMTDISAGIEMMDDMRDIRSVFNPVIAALSYESILHVSHSSVSPAVDV